MHCVFGVSLQGVPGFLRHSRQTSLGVYKMLVQGNPLLKSGRGLKTVQFSSGSSERSFIASDRLQTSLMKACLLLSCFSLEFQSFSLALSCLVVAVQAECAGSVYRQQACDLSSSLHHT